MFKLYKIIFISDIDNKQYVIYCNKNNMPIALNIIVDGHRGEIVFVIRCIFTIELFEKCKKLFTTLR